MLTRIQQNFSKTVFLIIALTICSRLGFGQTDKTGFKPIFDGKSLKGWEGDANLWRVENGSLVGEITPDKLLKTNSFIIWKGGEPADFELILEYRITATGNSGINYRSEKITDVPNALKGYQADIDGKNNYTGQNYEERARTTLAYVGQKTVIDPLQNAGASVRDNVKNNAWTGLKLVEYLGNVEELKSHIKKDDWNEVHLVIKGNRLQHFVNGILISDVTDNDVANRKMKGLLGVQVHVGPPMKVEFRNILIKQL